MKCIYCGAKMVYNNQFETDTFECNSCGAKLEITQHEESSLKDILDYGRDVKPIPTGYDMNGIGTLFIRGNK